MPVIIHDWFLNAVLFLKPCIVQIVEHCDSDTWRFLHKTWLIIWFHYRACVTADLSDWCKRSVLSCSFLLVATLYCVMLMQYIPHHRADLSSGSKASPTVCHSCWTFRVGTNMASILFLVIILVGKRGILCVCCFCYAVDLITYRISFWLYTYVFRVVCAGCGLLSIY